MPSDPPAPADDMPGDPDPHASAVSPDPVAPGNPDVTGAAMPGAPGDPAGGSPADLPADAPGDPAATDEGPGEVSSGTPSVPPGEPEVPEAALRVAEAVIFASASPVPASALAPLLPPGIEPRAVLHALAARTAGRGVALTPVAGGWAFRTAPDLAPAVTKVVEVPRRLPRAAMEALAIIAWHQPVTRPEIEEIRGASLSQTTLDLLLENGLVAPRGRKEAPGRPTLWGTTARFLDQFGLNSLRDLPRREELLPEPGLPFGTAPIAPPDAPPATAVPDDGRTPDGAPPSEALADASTPRQDAPVPRIPDAA